MNKKRITGPRRDAAMPLRFTAVRADGESIAFDGHGSDGESHRFRISTETLQAIAGPGDPDGGPLGTQPMRLFERCKPTIFGVASRAFEAGVRGDPIALGSALFRGAAVR